MVLPILKGFGGVLMAFLDMLKYPFYLIIALTITFMALCGLWYIYFVYIKKIHPQKALNNKRVKNDSFLYKLLYSAPKQFVYDNITKPPYFFPKQGMIIYEGRQGNGKTSTMVHDLLQIQKQHPYCEVLTNFDYVNQTESLEHWKQLIDYKNSTDLQAGVVACIDELQNWFSSKDSKNFDPQMLSIITQNRKNRRLILGTAQQFYMLSKDIRTQCTEVRHCTTFLGCITIVHKRIPVVDSAGEVVEWKNRGFYFWIHNKETRNSYDTWKCIERLDKKGFERRDEVGIRV